MAKWHIFTAAMLVSACATPGTLAQDDVLYVRTAMQQHVNPAIVEIWDVGNNAMNEAGGIDPALMTEERWTQLENAAVMLGDASRMMESAATLVAASPDNMATEEYEVSMADVQRYLDGDPEGFRRMAAAQTEVADQIAAAAQARDAATAGELVAALDGVCEACHAAYWYPEAQ